MALTDYYSVADDDELTPEEEEMIRHAEGAQSFGSGLGGLLGTGAGVGVAALTGGAATPLVPLFTGAGTLLGNFIGGKVAEDNSNKFEESREKRLKEENAAADRLARTNELLGSWIRTRGL